MPFRGLTMLKSRKLVIKGGLCYRFAMVILEVTICILFKFQLWKLKFGELS